MNLDPETRKGYYISAEMKRVWAVEMEMLNKLLEVCKKYNLRVFAEGGTLLGTVREHGYIPWDDDIDMAMPREDYDKLREIASEEFKAPYFFQCGYTDLFPRGQTKIRKNGTAAIFKYDIFKDYHHGIFIDILPLDSLPNDKKEFDVLLDERVKERSKLYLYCNYRFSFTNWVYNWNYLKLYLEVRKVGFNNYFSKYDNLMKKYSHEECDNVSIISWGDDRRYIRNKSWYREAVYLPFEDILIPVPVDYDLVLRKQYGDYLKPVKASSEHGATLVLDSEHSYLDYLPSLRKKHKWDRWKSRWDFIKRFFIQRK